MSGLDDGLLSPAQREANTAYSQAYNEYDRLNQQYLGLPWWAFLRRRRLLPSLQIAEWHLTVALRRFRELGR